LAINQFSTVVALGSFDGVHLGHAEVIKAAVSQNKYIPAVFTFRNAYKNTLNIIDTGTKHHILLTLGIKKLYIYDFERLRDFSPEEFVADILMKELNAKAVCCGYNFRFGKGGCADANELARICGEFDIKTIIVPPVKIDNLPVNSTHIRKLIAEGDIENANRFLGRELSYELEVVGGNKLGRTIGFPTINQNMPDGCVIPLFGVYKSRVDVKGCVSDGITNIGVKPTAGENNKVTIETHILGCGEDLYGEIIKVSLVSFIRPERKFGSFEELKQQINKDLEVANG